MKKEELRNRLKSGYKLDDIFVFSPGQDCTIFKAEKFEDGEEIIYIPDVSLNEIPVSTPIAVDDTIDNVIDCCYTGQDFIDQCGGDLDLAKRLFLYCDWQHPSSALPEIDDRDEEDDEFRMKVARRLWGWTVRLCGTVFGMSLAAQRMLENGEIECDDSGKLFYIVLQNAFEFERLHPEDWDRNDFPENYMKLVDDFAQEILIKNFGKGD